ncbi:MAG: LPS export ABC transporter periplasmic protein LptC [Robiginitomaculum sp.]
MNAALTSTASGNAGLWEPRRSLTLNAARRHSRFVKLFRFVLVLGSGLLLALLAYYIVEGPEKLVVNTEETESVRMTNPRYNGMDSDGVPYTLTADYAVRSRASLDAVRLINPVLKFSRSGEADASNITAKEGIYDSKAQTMELRSDVSVRIDDGYICQTSHARIHAVEKTVEGDEKISCTGRFGSVQGDSYKIVNNYTRFVFYGNVTGIILPEPKNDASVSPTDLETTP